MNIAKVEGHSDLYRDLNTNAIINSNYSEYEEYINRKNRQIDESQKISTLESKIEILNSEILEIKTLLIQLTHNYGKS